MDAPSPTHYGRTTLDWVILVALNFGVPIVTLWKYHTGAASARVALLSSAFVLLTDNIVVLLAFRHRYRRDGSQLPTALVAGAGTLAVACFMLTLLGVSSLRHHNVYADLASSDVPLSSIEPEQKRLVVELIRRAAANSQEENNAMAEALKDPMNPPVYSPASFLDKKTIDSTMAHLTKYTAIDWDYYAKQKTANEDFKRKMALTDPRYLDSWNASREQQEALDKSTYELEHECLASARLLYDYAAQHMKDISVKDGQLVIVDAAVRDAFTAQLDRSKALHERLVTSVKDQAKHQQELKNQLAGN